MNHWHFKLWHVLLLYGAALTLGSDNRMDIDVCVLGGLTRIEHTRSASRIC